MLNVNNSKPKIIEMIEKQNNCSLSEIFTKEYNIENIVINSPLESSLSEVTFLNIKNHLITILTYNLTVNLMMVYLIFILIFIFTIKFVLDTNILLEKIDNLPLGYYIKFFLKKYISV